MRAFITKYALTQGILEVEGKLDHDGEYLIWKNADSWMKQYTHKRDFCLTLEEAITTAEKTRIKKLQSLEKQAKRLVSMTVKVCRL